MKTIKTIGLATIATLALVGCGGGGGDKVYESNYTPYPYEAPSIDQGTINQYLAVINGARSVGRSCGQYGWQDATSPLEWSDALYKAAYEHTQDMASTGAMTHNGSNTGSDWTSQVQNLGYGSSIIDRFANNNAKSLDGNENIAKGYGSISSVVNAWLASDIHCRTLMYPHYKKVGVAQVGSFWSQEVTY